MVIDDAQLINSMFQPDEKYFIHLLITIYVNIRKG